MAKEITVHSDRQICGCRMALMKGISDVIDSHDHHDCAAYHIDGFDAVFCWCICHRRIGESALNIDNILLYGNCICIRSVNFINWKK